MVIALDFDGTIVEHKYPAIGEEIPFATETIRMLIAERHKVILWSVREGKLARCLTPAPRRLPPMWLSVMSTMDSKARCSRIAPQHLPSRLSFTSTTPT